MLDFILKNNKITKIILIGTFICFGLVVFFIPSNLKQEILGTPNSQFIWSSVHAADIQSREELMLYMDEFNKDLREVLGDSLIFTEYRIWGPSGAGMIIKIRKSSEVEKILTKLKKTFQENDELSFNFYRWNPDQLSLPRFPHFKVIFGSDDTKLSSAMAYEVYERLKEEKIFTQNVVTNAAKPSSRIELYPRYDLLGITGGIGGSLSVGDLMQVSRIMYEPMHMGYLYKKEDMSDVYLRYKTDKRKNLADYKGFPIGVRDKILPFQSLVKIKETMGQGTILSQNGELEFNVRGKLLKKDENNLAEVEKKAKEIISEVQKRFGDDGKKVDVIITDPKKELTESISELMVAVFLSFAIVCLILLLLFGNIFHTLCILVAIPMGIMGVLLSLYFFNSTLSLNSLLGIILLNGISVANSILLVDLIQKNIDKEKMSPHQAILMAAKKRIRPILLTSFTTIFGMLPIALGLGEGGKVLRPLGISVSGGLWVSLLFTLFLVPIMEKIYLSSKLRRDEKKVIS